MVAINSTDKMELMVIAVAFVICLIIPTTHQHEEHIELSYKEVTLKDVCSNRQVPIISIPDVQRLIQDATNEPETCPENYLQSFYELEPILTITEKERLCSEKKFQQIAEYHFRYINPKKEVYKLGDDLNNLNKEIVKRPLHEQKFDYTVQLDSYRQEIMIPISLQQFFKAWALQVSGLCKRAIIDNLERAVNVNLNETFLDMIDDLGKRGENNPLTNDSVKDLNFNGIVYLPELDGPIESGDEDIRKETTVMDLRSDERLNRFMHACKYAFEPIYSKLIMPVVRLAKLGYDYVGPKIDDIREQLYKGAFVRKWLAITAICEAQGKFELVDPDNQFKMTKINYEPMYSYKIDSELWIKGAEALRGELSRIRGHRATGFQKFLFDTRVGGRKVIAFLDPHQFAWYRRNQNTLSSALNVLSILSNGLGMYVTAASG